MFSEYLCIEIFFKVCVGLEYIQMLELIIYCWNLLDLHIQSNSISISFQIIGFEYCSEYFEEHCSKWFDVLLDL